MSDSAITKTGKTVRLFDVESLGYGIRTSGDSTDPVHGHVALGIAPVAINFGGDDDFPEGWTIAPVVSGYVDHSFDPKSRFVNGGVGGRLHASYFIPAEPLLPMHVGGGPSLHYNIGDKKLEPGVEAWFMVMPYFLTAGVVPVAVGIEAGVLDVTDPAGSFEVSLFAAGSIKMVK